MKKYYFKLNIILLIMIILIYILIQNVSAIQIPAKTTTETIIQYKNNQFNVLKGEKINNDTIEYDIKENDIITYADDNNIMRVYSKFAVDQTIPGHVMNYLYDDITINTNQKHYYKFKEKTPLNIIFENETTSSLAIYDLVVVEHNKDNEITTKYHYMDKKFNTIYRINNNTNKNLIKTNANQFSAIKNVNQKGVYYEPQN